MKKKIIFTLFMAFIATNIFAFQIGGTLGLGYGQVTLDKGNENSTIPNALVLFPHKYGDETNWGGRVEFGSAEMGFLELGYAVTYTLDVGLVKITPFTGIGFNVIPLGGSWYAGCAFTMPLWIGDFYADIRYGENHGVIYNVKAGTINIGYIFKFGNDRN